MKLVPLLPKRILYHAKLPFERVHFIETGLVLVTARTDAGSDGLQSWMVGQEGFTGIPVVLGVPSSPHRRIVGVEGSAWEMSAADLIQAMEDVPEFRQILLRYVHSVLVQTAQVGVCNARHPLNGRVACQLLMVQDRLETPEIPLTRRAIASMLGVRRASVTVVLQDLKLAGAIRIERNKITIADRPKLEAATCHCYEVLRSAFLQPTAEFPQQPI